MLVAIIVLAVFCLVILFCVSLLSKFVNRLQSSWEAQRKINKLLLDLADKLEREKENKLNIL